MTCCSRRRAVAFAEQLSARGHRPEAALVVASMGNDAGMVGAADLARV